MCSMAGPDSNESSWGAEVGTCNARGYSAESRYWSPQSSEEGGILA